MLKTKDKSKFIIYNHTTNEIDDKRLFELVYLVILNGKLSNNESEYCYLTAFKDGNTVSTHKTKTGYRFDIYNEDRVKRCLVEKVDQ